MKRNLVALIALLLCLALALTACGKSDEDPVTEPLDPIGPVDPVNPSDDIASSAFVGTFVNSYSALFASSAADVFPEGADYTPTLICNADGTFSLSVMSDMSARTMRTINGTFTISGDTAAFTATDGAGEVRFTMTFAGVDELRYAGDQIDCVSQGDLFARV